MNLLLIFFLILSSEGTTSHDPSSTYIFGHTALYNVTNFSSSCCGHKRLHSSQKWRPKTVNKKYFIYIYIYIHIYWTVHHCDSWRIRDQLDVISYYVLFHFFYAEHVSDINISIISSLRLFYCITTLAVCWSFGVAGLEWYPCSRLQHVSDIITSIIRILRLFYCINTLVVYQAEACYTDTTPTQPHRNSNTHRNKNTRPMWC